MKRKTYILASLILTLFVGAAAIWNYSAHKAAAQESDAVENLGVVPTEYNARDEFSNTQNPNGVWSYGYSTSDTDNTLNLFTFPNDSANGAGCGGVFEQWRINNGDQIPQITRHNPAATCLNIPANALFVHPGYNNQRAVTRWTAPSGGTFQITGTFQKQNPSATTDLKIIKNAASVGEATLFTAAIGAVSQQSFNFNVTVAAGDKIDFSVGDDGNNTWQFDGSSISINIGQPVATCLPPPADLQVFVPAENSPVDVESVNTNASLAGNATYTNAGKVGRAFELDGSGDYVRIEDNAAQRPATALTAEGWFKFDSASGIVSLISKPLRNTSLNSYTLYLDGGQLRGLVGNASQFTRVFSNFTPQPGVWHHLAFTYDFTGGVSTLKLYANGTEVTSGQDGTPNILPFYDASPFPLLIGGEYETNAPGFWLDGQADEISVYGRALSQTEIFDIVQQGGFGKCAPAPCAPTPDDLVSLFAGEQNALDSRSNNHGAPQNGAMFADGKVGQAFSLDGSNDYYSTADSPDWDFGTSDFAIEGWFNAPNPTGVQRIISAGSQADGANNLWSLGYGDIPVWGGGQRLNFAVFNGGGYSDFSSNPVTFLPNTWHHAAVVRSGSSLTFYLDGAAVGTVAVGAGFAINGGTTGAIIGARYNNNPSLVFEFAGGRLDEISVYRRALSAAEISSVYNAGSSGKCKPVATNAGANLVGFWTGGGDARDLAGEDQNAALVGAAFAVGKVGQAFNFTADPQNVSIPDSAAMRPVNFTVEAWTKSLSNSGTRHIFAKTLGAGVSNSYVLWVDNGILNGAICQADNNCSQISTAAPNTGEWHHLALSFDDPTDSLRIYIDGVPAASGTTALSIGYDAHAVLIGADYGNEVIFDSWRGLLDEVSFYNRALSASEIAAVYSAGAAGKIKAKTVIAIQPLAAQSKDAQSGRLLAPATVQLSDATVSFADVISGGTVSENGIDLGFYPPLPSSVRFTGLAYDIRTTAVYQQGSADDVQVCFNLPALAALNFANLRILHLENGVWVNRSATTNTSPVICTDNLTSLSPFVIVEALAPTAARVSVSGRVADASGAALGGIGVSLTDSQGRSVSTRTNNFGRYSFAGVAAGEIYVVSVASGKRYSFTVSSQAVNVQDAVENVDFTADSDAFRLDETKP